LFKVWHSVPDQPLHVVLWTVWLIRSLEAKRPLLLLLHLRQLPRKFVLPWERALWTKQPSYNACNKTLGTLVTATLITMPCSNASQPRADIKNCAPYVFASLMLTDGVDDTLLCEFVSSFHFLTCLRFAVN
jgi:hypothetical protein